MTEAEWFTSNEPWAMCQFIRPRTSTRKLRLFACACCRRIEHCQRSGEHARGCWVVDLLLGNG
jgi:hypothetical protein